MARIPDFTGLLAAPGDEVAVTRLEQPAEIAARAGRRMDRNARSAGRPNPRGPAKPGLKPRCRIGEALAWDHVNCHRNLRVIGYFG